MRTHRPFRSSPARTAPAPAPLDRASASLRWTVLAGLAALGLAACDTPPPSAPPVLDAGPVESPCDDLDGDGFGPGCAAGFDCAPDDASVTNECEGCDTPATGCACDEGAEPTHCVLDPVEVNGATMCYAGVRHCRDGRWTECVDLRSYALPAAPADGSGVAVEPLLEGPASCGNPCDPLCRYSRDTPGPGDVPPGSGLTYTPTPGGITLARDPSTTSVTLPDADGDGVPDSYDSAPMDPTVTGYEGGFFRVLPYGTTSTGSRSISTRVRTVDVYFLVDTTGSMGGEIANLRTSLSSTIIPGIRTAIPDAWFGVGYHDDYPVSPYGSSAYGDRVYWHLRDLTSDTTAAQASVNTLVTHYGVDIPESQTQALWAVASGGGIGTYLTGRTGCPAGRWGYPCFRDGTIPIVILITDAGYHNGPYAPWNYASTAGGVFAAGPTQVVPAPFYTLPASTPIVHRMDYPVPVPPTPITHWEGWSPSTTAPITHVSRFAPPTPATNITHASLLGTATPTSVTHATSGTTGVLPATSSPLPTRPPRPRRTRPDRSPTARRRPTPRPRPRRWCTASRRRPRRATRSRTTRARASRSRPRTSSAMAAPPTRSRTWSA